MIGATFLSKHSRHPVYYPTAAEQPYQAPTAYQQPTIAPQVDPALANAQQVTAVAFQGLGVGEGELNQMRAALSNLDEGTDMSPMEVETTLQQVAASASAGSTSVQHVARLTIYYARCNPGHAERVSQVLSVLTKYAAQYPGLRVFELGIQLVDTNGQNAGALMNTVQMMVPGGGAELRNTLMSVITPSNPAKAQEDAQRLAEDRRRRR